MKKFLHINVSNGEIVQVAKLYGLVPNNLHNTTINDGTILLYEVEDGQDVDDWVHSKYYRDGQFYTKPSKPSLGLWIFENYTWVADQQSLQRDMRHMRDDKLYKSDWRLMPDSTLTDEQRVSWGAYRQALRDIPASYPNLTDLNDIVWPTEPS